MNSAIFKGQVKHRRTHPAKHEFRYGMFMMYLDLAELDEVFTGRWLWSARRRAPARFRREDHLGDFQQPLDDSVRDCVEAALGERPTGPIRLLTHLSYFGYCFNPVSFYYCFDESDRKLETIVAEVNNTPWKEQHCYVLACHDMKGPVYRHTPAKQMHVSPFMPMDTEYDWRFNAPGQRLTVHMENSMNGVKMFDATLDLERQEINGFSLASVLLTYPLMTLKVMAAIHFEALRLWLKKVPLFTHPDKIEKQGGETP